MTHQEYQAARAMLRKQVQLMGVPDMLKRHRGYTPDLDGETFAGLPHDLSLSMYGMMHALRQAISSYRDARSVLPDCWWKENEDEARSAAYVAYTQFRKSASPLLSTSLYHRDWGVWDGDKKKQVEVCVSPAWHKASKPLQRLMDDRFVFYSRHVGNEMHRVRIARYEGGKVVMQPECWLAADFDLGLYGLGDSTRAARHALNLTRAKITRDRLRGKAA